MRTLAGWLGVFVASATLGGCANTIVVDDLQVWESRWQQIQPELRRRAAFELPCPEQEIKLTLLATHKHSFPAVPALVGATGCGKRVTYRQQRDESWVQDARTHLADPLPQASQG